MIDPATPPTPTASPSLRRTRLFRRFTSEPDIDVKMMATSEVPCASCWESPRRRTLDGMITIPPPIPAMPANRPATAPMATAMARERPTSNPEAAESGLAPLTILIPATSITRPKTIVRVLALNRCISEVPTTDPTMPPIPMVTPSSGTDAPESR